MNALVVPNFESPRTAAAVRGGTLAEPMVRVLKAMAHRERLAILCLLLDGEMCVRDLEHGVGMRQAALSQQLSRLRAENIVEAVRHGRFMLYRLKNPQVQAVVRAVCREIHAA